MAPTIVSRRAFLIHGLGLVGWALARPPSASAATLGYRPILLVNGFADQSSIWRRPDNLVTSGLVGAGYRLDGESLLPFAYPPKAQAPQIEDSQGDIAVAGLALAATIISASSWSATRQVDLVGFSMGGLVARSAINALRRAEANGPPLVNTTILIGTPNRGIDILSYLRQVGVEQNRSASEALRDYAGIDLDSVAVSQMMPDSAFLRDLNSNQIPDSRVRYVSIAASGLARTPSGIEFSVGDGVVSPASASHLPGVSSLAYVLHDTISTDLSSLLDAVRRSTLFHPRLLFNDAVAAIAVAELQPGAEAAHRDLEWFQKQGIVTSRQL